MRNSVQDLIHWKTDAWKDHDMVAWYSKRMVENSGTNRLKNAIEVALCEQLVSGTDILDVGIGTGRASLPLLAKGYRLSGTDSSQAMLDECRRLANGAEIELVPGDVTALPFGDGRFDSIISLNVMTHFPHVEDVLREWKRVVKPGGRLIFDIYSLDHLSFARGKPVDLASLLAQQATDFNMHLSAEALVEAASNAGLKILGTIPYGSLFSGEYYHWRFPMPLQKTHWWRRQLSWMVTDNAMLNLAMFLEQSWFGCLTGITTGRFMVVLENGEDHNANQQWLAQDTQLGRYLANEPVRLQDLEPWLGQSAAQWREQFERHLITPRNRMLAYFLFSTCLGRPDAVDWADLAPRYAAQFQRWADAEAMDRHLQGFVKSWHDNTDVADLCMENGVDMAAGLEYQLQRKLVNHFVHQPTGAEQ